MIRFLLDDEEIELQDAPADLTVLDWLRVHRARVGTKEGCGSGDCGACTVVVVSPHDDVVHGKESDVDGPHLQYQSVNACIAFVGSLHGRQLLTVESLEQDGSLHPVQQAMLDEHGSQCGFCTPGFVMSMFALSESADAPQVHRQAPPANDDHILAPPGEPTPVTEARRPSLVSRIDESEHADAVVVDRHPGATRPLSSPGGWLAGLHSDDVQALSHRIDQALGGNLCRCTGYRPIKRAAAVALSQQRSWLDEHASHALAERLRSLAASTDDDAGPVLSNDGYRRPVSLAALARLRLAHPDAPLVAGATDLALEVTQRLRTLPLMLSTTRVPELQRLERIDDVLYIGAAVSLQRLYGEFQTSLPEAARLLLRFGSDPIRNAGTLGGNLGSASPIGDLPPVLLALGATLLLQRGDDTRQVDIDDYFIDYRQTRLQAGEFIREVQLPLPAPAALFAVHKVSKRMDDDISTVCAAFHLTFADDDSVASARIAYGGMAAMPRRAERVEAALTGRRFDDAAVERAAAQVVNDFAPISDARASAGYRLEVAANLLRRTRLERQHADVLTRTADLERQFMQRLGRAMDERHESA